MLLSQRIIIIINIIRLLSKDDEVVSWGLRVLTKVTFELGNCDKLFHVY